MNQELMTLDFWQDTVIYEGKTFPVGTLACDALNVPADTITKMNEQCEKINLLLGMLNAGQDTSALFPMAKEAALTMLEIAAFTTTCDWCVYNRIFVSRTAEWGEMEEGVLDMSTYYYEANPASVLLDNINAARQTWNYG